MMEQRAIQPHPVTMFRQFKESLPTIYDSRAVTTEEWPIVAWWYYEHGPVWECLPPRAGVIYLRRHLHGPVNTTSPGWMPA